VPDPAAALASVVRTERTRLVATLVRRYGFDLAEEAVDAAIEAALAQWPREGAPASPRAWLLAVARRRAIDRVRHRVTADEVHGALSAFAPPDAAELDDAAAFPDDRLRLLFTCCHPAIAREAQVALALRWLSGLSTEDVARAFCVPVPTMAQRLTRARSKIETARIPYEVPEARELGGRLSSVLEVVYAIFNEGYVATAGPELQRNVLADEALHLAALVSELLPESAEAKAMRALLLLVHARRRARVSPEGELVPLDEQDRAAWDQDAIAHGKALLAEALASGRPTAYAIEAAIQALHDEAPTYEATDFPQILVLYRLLRQVNDAPVVALNEAVARAMVDGPEAALADVLALERGGALAAHPAIPAAKADLLRRLGRAGEARRAYDEAIAGTKNEAEQRFFRRRKAAIQ
jgi:RNA polymerase sigma-70 factor, ECF subfamily